MHASNASSGCEDYRMASPRRDCSLSPCGVPRKPESLRVVARRIASALLRADWQAFRKDALPFITIEEHWQAYDSYFVTSSERRDYQPYLGECQSFKLEYSTVLPNERRLSPRYLRLFKAFCKQAKLARSYHSDAWGEWPLVQEKYGDHVLDFHHISGPNLSGKIASNLDIAIEMVRTDGTWKAHRLMLVGH